MHTEREFAYAKVNLFLDVLARRDDGFHDVKTVMQSVSLYDELLISEAPAPSISIKLSISGASHLPCDERNLAYRAAYRYLSTLGINAEVTIKLKKHIPVAAGLAGGSSDAAAVLRGLNKLFGRRMSRTALLGIAAELGSDVPFCLIGGAAVCEGRGEIMTAVKSRDISLVIAIGDEHVSTPEAYAMIDKIYLGESSFAEFSETAYKKLLDFLSGATDNIPPLFNAFEYAVLPGCPKAAKIKEHILSFGADSAVMSGSGPSVYGIFKDEEKAIACRDWLRSLGFFAEVAKSV